MTKMFIYEDGKLKKTITLNANTADRSIRYAIEDGILVIRDYFTGRILQKRKMASGNYRIIVH